MNDDVVDSSHTDPMEWQILVYSYKPGFCEDLPTLPRTPYFTPLSCGTMRGGRTAFMFGKIDQERYGQDPAERVCVLREFASRCGLLDIDVGFMVWRKDKPPKNNPLWDALSESTREQPPASGVVAILLK